MEWVETTGKTIEEAKEAALDQLGPDAEKIQPLFITIDPARDTYDDKALFCKLKKVDNIKRNVEFYLYGVE